MCACVPKMCRKEASLSVHNEFLGWSSRHVHLSGCGASGPESNLSKERDRSISWWGPWTRGRVPGCSKGNTQLISEHAWIALKPQSEKDLNVKMKIPMFLKIFGVIGNWVWGPAWCNCGHQEEAMAVAAGGGGSWQMVAGGTGAGGSGAAAP